MIRVFAIAVYLISLVGCWISYHDKDIRPGCLGTLFSIIPLLNTVIFLLFVFSTDEKGKLRIAKLFGDPKEKINDIFTNDDIN